MTEEDGRAGMVMVVKMLSPTRISDSGQMITAQSTEEFNLKHNNNNENNSKSYQEGPDLHY